MHATRDLCRPIYSEFGADPDLGMLVELFVDEMPVRIRGLRKAFEDRDWALLRRLAHQLKGSAGSYGFGQITPFAATLEQAVASGESAPAIGEQVDRLTDLLQRTRAGMPVAGSNGGWTKDGRPNGGGDT